MHDSAAVRGMDGKQNAGTKPGGIIRIPDWRPVLESLLLLWSAARLGVVAAHRCLRLSD